MKTLFVIPLFILSIIFPESIYAQYYTVSGNISGYLSSDSICYANVVEANSGFATISNNNGFYSLHFKPGPRIIKVNENGYENFELKFDLKTDTVINVVLIPNNFATLQKQQKVQAAENSKLQTNNRKRFLFF